MKKIRASKLAEILGFGGDLVDVEVQRVETDSRKIQKGDLFIAIKGEKFDGHNFVKQVIESGAELVVVEELVEGVDVKNLQKEITFKVGENEYSLTLTKHRPPKK